ncbi:MAG: Cys-rich peptide radical SAM maturase CcpM [Lachnospiraceae bacterium]|nr:Cys-rich peptide radical SAM maturase CcpM [Lachnospiraceae bacterium]
MQETRVFIHLFKTLNSYYLYDVNSNSIVKINEEMYSKLKSKKEIDDDLQINKLKERGFLQPISRNITIQHPLTEKVESYLQNNMSLLILQVTQNCNLRCKYCVYSGSYINRVHTNKRMSFEIAKEAVDFYYEHSKNTDIASISFYGGEPLLEFKLIKDVVEYCEEKFSGKQLNFNMTTNATLLTTEMMHFLQLHKINLTISLDGPEEIHNKGRVFADCKTGTFSKIMDNLNEFQQLYPDYVDTISFNAVFDEENNFKLSSDFFSFDFLKKATVTFTTVSNRDIIREKDVQEEFVINYKYELFKMFLCCIGRVRQENASKLMSAHINKLKQSIHEHLRAPLIVNGKTHPNGPCIPGVNRLFVTVDGELFPCERVSETNSIYNIGNLKTGFKIERIKELLNIGKYTEKQCSSCWAMGYCSSCVSDMGEGNKLVAKKRLEQCAAIRFTTDELMKEYCVLRENGYSFE